MEEETYWKGFQVQWTQVMVKGSFFLAKRLATGIADEAD